MELRQFTLVDNEKGTIIDTIRLYSIPRISEKVSTYTAKYSVVSVEHTTGDPIIALVVTKL